MRSFDAILRGTRAIKLLRKIRDACGPAYSFSREVEALLKEENDANARAQGERAEKQARAAKRRTSGRKNSGKFEIAPSVESGCDHGATGLVLARRGEMRLVWRSGGTYRSGIGQQAYAPAELEVLSPGETMPKRVTNHFGERAASGAFRLTSALILKHAERIDSIFGKGVARQVSALAKTVVLGGVDKTEARPDNPSCSTAADPDGRR